MFYSIDEELVKKVIEGKKPGASVSYIPRHKDLFIENEKDYYFISLNRKAGEFLSPKKIYIDYSSLDERVLKRAEKLFKKIKNKRVCSALKYLYNYPREDEDFPQIKILRGERPEVSLIEGILYGYQKDSINNYIKRKIMPVQSFFMKC